MSNTAAVAQESTSVQPRLRDALTIRQVIILGIGLFSSVSTYMLIPFFAIYYHHALGFSMAVSGFLTGLPFLSSLLFGVIGGALTDRLGAPRTSAIAMTVYGLCMGALALLRQPIAIGTVMVVAGIMMPVMSGGISSILNDSAPPEHRGLLQNALYWVANVGVIIGLLVAAEVLNAGHSATPLFVTGGLRIVLAVVLFAFFALVRKPGRTNSEESQVEAPKKPRPTVWSSIRMAAADKALLFAALTILALMLMEAQVSSVVPLDLTAHFHNGSQIYGPIIAINAVVVVVGQPLVMKLMNKRPPVLMFGLGALLTGIGLAIGGVIGTIPAWIVGVFIYSVGEALWNTKINDLLGNLPTKGNSALYFSAIITAQNLAFFVGTSGGSTMYAFVGPKVLFTSLVVVGILAALFFRGAVSAYGRRAALEASNSTAVAEFPGVDKPSESEATASDTSHDGQITLQGAASFLPRSSGQPLLGISTQADRLVLLESLSTDQWERLLGATEVVTFRPGDMVFHAGEESELALYLVQKGQLEVVAPGHPGNGPVLSVIDAGSVFGEQAFVDGHPRSASVRAVTEGELRRLNRDAFEQLSQTDPILAQIFLTDLARVLSERLRRTTQVVNLMQA